VDMVFDLFSGTVGESGRVSIVVRISRVGIESCGNCNDVVSRVLVYCLESVDVEIEGTNLVETDVGGLLTEALTADVHL
jgi:hypothetical protein